MPPNRLREIRHERGLTMAEVAKVAGVDPSTVSRWEHGLVQIPDSAKLDLSAYYDVALSWLMGWEDWED